MVIDDDNTRHQLFYKDFEFIPLKYWKSNKSNITYPIEWEINIPSLNIYNILVPIRYNQEGQLFTKYYWDGIIKTNNAIGYTELFGYPLNYI